MPSVSTKEEVGMQTNRRHRKSYDWLFLRPCYAIWSRGRMQGLWISPDKEGADTFYVFITVDKEETNTTLTRAEVEALWSRTVYKF